MKSIVTHMNPDMDAIASAWLLKSFGGFQDAEIKFVNTGNPDYELINKAQAVVDTGKEYDVNFLHFDHHQLPSDQANNTCAAMQVYKYLLSIGKPLDYLAPLIDLVFYGDTGRPEANQSREIGLHAIFSGWKAQYTESYPNERLPDAVILAYGMSLLDQLEVRLRKQAEARAELGEKTVYKSADGLVWAIRHGSQGSTFAAGDEGARIVVFEGEPLEVEGGLTFPVGIWRQGEWQEPYAGQLVEKCLEILDYELVSGVIMTPDFEIRAKEELSRWFRHNAGFFAGRGTAKAPMLEPVEVDLRELAELIDSAWER